jgi:hypothetical protein
MQSRTQETDNKDYIKKKHFFISKDKYDKKHKAPLSTQVIYNRKHPTKAGTRKTQTTQNKQNPPKKNPKNTKSSKTQSPQTPTTLKPETYPKHSMLKNVSLPFPTPRGRALHWEKHILEKSANELSKDTYLMIDHRSLYIPSQRFEYAYELWKDTYLYFIHKSKPPSSFSMFEILIFSHQYEMPKKERIDLRDKIQWEWEKSKRGRERGRSTRMSCKRDKNKMWKPQWRWQRETQKPKLKRDKILAREGVVRSRERKKETLKLSKKENLRRSGVWIEREGEGQVHRLSETMRGENGVHKLFFLLIIKNKKNKTETILRWLNDAILVNRKWFRFA